MTSDGQLQPICLDTGRDTGYVITGHNGVICESRTAFLHREELGDGTVVELRLWRVPRPVTPSHHVFKYALFYGRPGTRLVLFDNERGKGDHKHIREVESPYVFSTPEALVADFLAAVRATQQEDQGNE